MVELCVQLPVFVWLLVLLANDYSMYEYSSKYPMCRIISCSWFSVTILTLCALQVTILLLHCMWSKLWSSADVTLHVIIQGVINDREHRISELEEALRESIRITAQREVVMHEQQMKLEHTERVVSYITNNTD